VAQKVGEGTAREDVKVLDVAQILQQSMGAPPAPPAAPEAEDPTPSPQPEPAPAS
jgi:hypothetical protein